MMKLTYNRLYTIASRLLRSTVVGIKVGVTMTLHVAVNTTAGVYDVHEISITLFQAKIRAQLWYFEKW